MTSRHFSSRSLLFIALSIAVSHASAAVALGDHLSLSGFGTAAAIRTDTDDAEYIRESQSSGPKDSFDLGTDSNLGLQLSGRANGWLSATVQTLSKRRKNIYSDTQLEWAFIKFEPLSGLAIRGGLMAIPTFAISDSRNIGYANPWIHAPNEVYGLAVIDQLRGGDVSYGHDLGQTTLTATVLTGTTMVPSKTTDTDHKMKGIKGVNLVWETPWVTLRAGRVEGDLYVPYGQGLIAVVDYRFTGFGALVSRNNVLLQAEYVIRESDSQSRYLNSKGWYALGGYRVGDWQPFVSYATSKPEELNALTGEQSTASLGLRWDFHKAMDLKVQWDRVDTKGSNGLSFVNAEPTFDGKANVFGIALDFVF